MDQIIITDQEVDKLVTLLKKSSMGFYFDTIEFDSGIQFAMNPTFIVPGEIFERTLKGDNLINYWKKIFSGRSLSQIKNAFIKLRLMNPIRDSSSDTYSFSLIKHEFDNICMDRMFSMISNINDKTNDTSDKLNILIDVLDLKQTA